MKKIIAIICAAFIAGAIFGNSFTPVQASAQAKRSTSVTAPSAKTSSLSSIPSAKSATYSSNTMKVSIQASCISNNSVGSDWSKSFLVNGSPVSSGFSVTLKAGDTVTVKSTIIERDDGGDDVGTATSSRTLTQSDINNGFSISQSITVRENGGRYKGHTAEWSVTYSFRK